MNPRVVKSVEPYSIAEECAIEKGDIIEKIDGFEIKDFLDFKFYTASDHYVLTVIKKDGEVEEIEVYNDDYEELGVEFENQLMDEPKRCKNNCIFCFMDQLPKDVRPTMYFKDDDVRLSFLQGNYVTLTNLSEEDIERIIRLKISPINVSVHATDPDVRHMMLKNPNAKNCLDIMKRFRDGGICMNGQIVLCKGINDGDILKKTITELSELYPYIKSISIVPVGLSKYREGLYELKEFSGGDLAEVIDLVAPYQKKFLKEYGTSLVYLSDEFYIKSGRDIPCYEHYEDFPQIENGVGMAAVFMKEFNDCMENSDDYDVSEVKKKTIVTSKIMHKILSEMLEKMENKWGKLPVCLKEITNNFFGENIIVTGLLCGSDIVEQLKGCDIGEELLLCDNMIKSGTELFLDDYTVSMVEKELGVKVVLVANDGWDFVESVMR